MSGFTLLEIMVTITIILILTGIITASWPRFRERQNILMAREQVQAVLSRAQQQALNEERDQSCLNHVGSDQKSQQRCSDIGVAIKGATLRIFADTDGNTNTYTPSDFVLEERTLPEAVQATGATWQSFLFKGIPPILQLYGPNGILIQGSTKASVNVVTGQTQRTLYISPYGHVEE